MTARSILAGLVLAMLISSYMLTYRLGVNVGMDKVIEIWEEANRRNRDTLSRFEMQMSTTDMVLRSREMEDK